MIERNPRLRLVIVTNGNVFARIILDRLFVERALDIAGVVIVTGVKTGKSKMQSLREILARSGLRFFVYKVSLYAVFALAGLLSPRRSFFVYGLAKAHGVPLFLTDQVNRPETLEQVRAWNPDVLASVSCPQIIRPPLLELPRQHAINIHSSLLPAYAGIAPYFWVLANGEERTGTTVHTMDEKLDTGRVIVQRQVAIDAEASVLSLFLQLSLLGSEALAEAVDRIGRGETEFPAQDLDGRTYFGWPTASSVRTFLRAGGRLARVSDYLRVVRTLRRCVPRQQTG